MVQLAYPARLLPQVFVNANGAGTEILEIEMLVAWLLVSVML